MRRNSLAAAVVVVVALSALACADYYGQRREPAKNVREILDHPVDDMQITLRGLIVERVEKDDYLFSDGTGEIIVDIDDDELPKGRPLQANTHVEIHGEVEYKIFKKLKIDAKRVRIIPAGEVPDEGDMSSP